jgi:uncharacterized protein
VVSVRRRLDAEAFIRAAATWSATRADLVAAVVVGSWARGDARDDSDVDLILLTNDPGLYTESEQWIDELAPGAVLINTADWGAIVERRLALSSALEVEVGIGRPSWADTAPIDPGTRRVVREGFRPIFDPIDLLAALAAQVSDTEGG